MTRKTAFTLSRMRIADRPACTAAKLMLNEK
jgi:hypothetical protein